MVVGVRDHAVEIEKNGFRRHEWSADPPFDMNGMLASAIISNRATSRQIIDKASRQRYVALVEFRSHRTRAAISVPPCSSSRPRSTGWCGGPPLFRSGRN